MNPPQFTSAFSGVIRDASFKQLIVCNLRVAIWDFSTLFGKLNRFYLNWSDLTVTLPSQVQES